LRPKTTEQVRCKTEQVFTGRGLSFKRKILMSHKTDSLQKIALVVQTAKPDDEQNRAPIFSVSFSRRHK
jgi:hypothetical protein